MRKYPDGSYIYADDREPGPAPSGATAREKNLRIERLEEEVARLKGLLELVSE